jgi:hypothetical protein
MDENSFIIRCIFNVHPLTNQFQFYSTIIILANTNLASEIK